MQGGEMSPAHSGGTSSCSSRPHTEFQPKLVVLKGGKMEGEALVFAKLHLLIHKGNRNWG